MAITGRFGAWSWTTIDDGMSYLPSVTYTKPDGFCYVMTIGYGDEWGDQVVGMFDDNDGEPEDTAPIHHAGAGRIACRPQSGSERRVSRADWSKEARRAFLAGDVERFRFCAEMARTVES